MLNKAILIGNLGADIEKRFTQDGTCVCNLSLATSEKFKNKNGERQEHTEWHRVVMWGKLAEVAEKYLAKGSRVYIEGKIETKKWQDSDGNNRYTTQIRAHDMKMLGSKVTSQSDRENFPDRGGMQHKNDATDPFAGEITEDGLPF